MLVSRYLPKFQEPKPKWCPLHYSSSSELIFQQNRTIENNNQKNKKSNPSQPVPVFILATISARAHPYRGLAQHKKINIFLVPANFSAFYEPPIGWKFDRLLTCITLNKSSLFRCPFFPRSRSEPDPVSDHHSGWAAAQRFFKSPKRGVTTATVTKTHSFVQCLNFIN